MTTALLLVDIQQGLIDAKPYAVEERVVLWQKALNWARESKIPVIFMRHTDDELIEDSDGWQIIPELVLQDDDIVLNKSYNSAFKETSLQEILTALGVNRLVIVGMQTEYCIAATVTVAFELGYEVAVIEGGTTTFDTPDISAPVLIEHYENLWANRFATVDFLEEIIKEEEI